jgi:hypothetical protein
VERRYEIDYRFHVCAYPAPDVGGQWIGHCLELELVTQGNSAEHAIEMLQEAVVLTLTESEPAGVPPLQQPSAETLLTFASAPVRGRIDLTVGLRWEPDHSQPVFEVAAAPSVALAG